MDGVLTTHCVYPEGGGTQARYANLEPSVYGGENGTKQNIKEDGASLEESNAVENDILAYITSHVHFSTNVNNILPSAQTWNKSIAMPHDLERVLVRTRETTWTLKIIEVSSRYDYIRRCGS